MKKLLIYATIAAVIGLILTLVPFVAFRAIEAGRDYAMGRFLFSEGSEKFEGNSGLEVQKYSVNEIAILTISFVIAFFAYVLFKFGMSH